MATNLARAIMSFSLSPLIGRRVGLVVAPVAAALMLFLGPPVGLTEPAWITAACMTLMAIWWMTEAIPVPVTALLPIVLFPLFGIAGIKETTASYAHPIIYLFLGGFLLALAIEKWNLHRRIALTILLSTGGNARSLMAGFMVTSALLSMWISNTATTIMLLPIGLAIISVISDTVRDISDKEQRNFQTALLLSIAYSATIGGVATLIGTPPNAFMAAFLLEHYQIDVSFAQWMLVGLPVTIIMLPITWLFLSRIAFPFSFETSEQTHDTLMKMKSELGRASREEKIISAVFIITALSWATRPFLDNYIPGLSDPGIAIVAGITLFLIPAPEKGGGRLLTWADTQKWFWGILVLFGGGLALANAVSSSGLAAAIGGAVASLQFLDLALVVVVVTTLVIFLTEMTSNLATTATFLPVIGAIAIQLGFDPAVLIVPITLAASCAFMLPVATPPNAIIYSSEKITIPQMAKAGFALNLLSITVVSLISVFAVPMLLQAL
jgi:solute carrier family 13 (sodium-dependent dicarboxylate transporter), member 2/3/5